MSENKLGSIFEDALKHEDNYKPTVQEQANIKIFGVGGAGCNMVNWLHGKGIQGATTYVVNTDRQHLDMMSVEKKILIGQQLTRGLGCGGFPDKGREASKENTLEIKKALANTDMVFVTAGMGGGTGTGAAPEIAKLAKEQGAIVIGAVTMPFDIERARIDKAEFGLEMLRDVSDTVIVIDNNRLVNIAGNLPIQQAFAVANELVSTMIKGIVEIIAVPSLVNLDYADVKAIMANGDVSVIGIGESDSEHRVEEAVKRALSNPLLDVSYEGANGALIHVSGGEDLTLDEVNKAGSLITEALDPDSNVIWGARLSDELNGKIRVMTIVTGVNSPYILGKVRPDVAQERNAQLSEELGLDVI
ncbi:MAG: cell division protein FtsZ [Nanoarchaeota archaeon]|nr:cell division protein FtsZ [Nanoarchaeota archaeon]